MNKCLECGKKARSKFCEKKCQRRHSYKKDYSSKIGGEAYHEDPKFIIKGKHGRPERMGTRGFGGGWDRKEATQ